MATAEPKSSAERITQKDRIIAVLQRIRDARSVLLVHFERDNNIFTSAVLEVDVDKQLVMFDELNPSAGHDKFLATKAMYVTARLEGISARFRVNLKTTKRDQNPAIYVTALPEKIIYEQRRASFRVRVPQSVQISVTVVAASGNSYTGSLMDISAHGVGAYIDKSAPFDKEEQDYTCRIDLPDGTFISGEMEMKFLKMDEKLDQWQIGGQFVNLSGPQNNTVSRFVMGLQRSLIKLTRDQN